MACLVCDTGEQFKYANVEGNGQDPPARGNEQHVGPIPQSVMSHTKDNPADLGS